MPVEIVGLSGVLKAMRQFEPELSKELNSRIRQALTPIKVDAQGLVPDRVHGLSNWSFNTTGRKINKETSAFASYDRFPKFNSGIVRKGIKISVTKSKKTRNGFSYFYRITNTSRAGSIMETAGRTHRQGLPWDPNAIGNRSGDYSKSRNPHAGEWFINQQRITLAGSGKMRGRLLYRAFHQDQGHALALVEDTIKSVIARFVARANAHDVWTIR
jgi:hypothetical protein